MSWYIGLMSGTSMDGVDGVVLDFSARNGSASHSASAPIAPDLRASLLALNRSGTDELHRAALATNALMRVYGQVVQALLAQAGLAASQVRAIGAHGQTVRHRPQLFDGTGYTMQLCNPALLAEITGIDVVADFRSRDVAAGGQGAPLAPFFHRAWFAQAERSVGVLNIGGISNLTVLQADGQTIGFDCGPGNVLMDGWCAQHTGQSFDAEGAWAAGGHVIEPLLVSMLAEPYFALPAPKSTGRDLFHLDWLAQHLHKQPAAAPQDVQASLLELTARSIADSVRPCLQRGAAGMAELIVCGGGAFNAALMQRLAALLPEIPVINSAERGLPPQDVEPTAFAWLAQQCVERKPLPLASVTGARGSRILGGIYPA